MITSFVSTLRLNRLSALTRRCAIEDKIRGRYPEAEFQLACGSDDELHLSVFTANRSPDDVMTLVEEEQDSLESNHGLFVFILPRSLEQSGA